MSETTTRVPQQERSIEKKRLIKKTAINLFSSNGYHSVSTNEIAKKAGVSIGTLYSYFPNKETLYKELVSDMYNEILSQVVPETTVSPLSPREVIKGYINLLVKSHTYMTAFQKEVASLSYQSEEFRKLEEPFKKMTIEKIKLLLVNYQSVIKVKDLDVASHLIETCIEAVIHEVSFFEKYSNQREIIDSFVDMIYNYLF